MPTYRFRCANGDEFDARYPMADVPARTRCERCGLPADRRLSAPRLSLSGSEAFRLIDRTKASADTPEVVGSLPRARSGTGTRITHNPLHQRLPRS